MAVHLSGFFDESGKFKDKDVIAFCGCLGTDQEWFGLQHEWDRLLMRHGITSLHMSGNALNFKRSLSGKRPALGREARVKVLLEFVRAIKQNMSVGIAIAVHVKDYIAIAEHHRKFFAGEDAHYWAFTQAMVEVLGYLRAIPDSKANIILDDEEKYFIECYKLMTKYKLREPGLRAEFISMSAADDRYFPQLQVADLLAYITRAEAAYQFLGMNYYFRELFEELERPAEKFKFSPATAFWNKQAMDAYIKLSEAKKRK